MALREWRDDHAPSAMEKRGQLWIVARAFPRVGAAPRRDAPRRETRADVDRCGMSREHPETFSSPIATRLSHVTSRVLFNTRLRHGLRRTSRVRFRKMTLGNRPVRARRTRQRALVGAPRVTSVTASRLLRDATSGNSRYRRIFRDSEARCILIGTKSPHGRAFGAPTAYALERLRSGMHAVPVRRSPESSLCRPHL